jgi:hypothetical protein
MNAWCTADRPIYFSKRIVGLWNVRRVNNMCGRYLVSTEDEIIEMREIIYEINERYKDKPDLASMKTGEIFPTTGFYE